MIRASLAHVILLALVAGATVVPAAAHARITRLEILRTESPTFEGQQFGAAGAYEKIVAKAHGEIDPQAEGNSIITDIGFAPRNAAGRLEYSTEVVILKPVDTSKGNGRIFYETVNRGRKLALATFNGASQNNDPSSAAHAGSGFLMRQGYTVVWSGWESDDMIGTIGGLMTAKLPVAQNTDGSPIIGRTIFEHAFDQSSADRFRLIYPAATLDKTLATLLVRANSKDSRKPVPVHLWSYVDKRTVQIERKDAFFAGYDAGAGYELVYQATDPVILGLGFAATRDLVSFLRHDTSGGNPVRGAIRHALAHGNSQSGRYLKGFVYWGFNRDDAGRKVFDSVNPHVSGAHAIASNERFGDANATGRPFHRYTIAKMEFPFTYEVRSDPLTGRTDGIFARCRKTDTCPKVFHTDSGNEAFLKAMNLVTTDGQGRDIGLPSDVRMYYIRSTQHAPAAKPTAGICQHLGNPSDWRPYLRALVTALDAWATAGTPPPESRYPTVKDGTLVAALPQASQGFPAIPGVTYNGWHFNVHLLDNTHLPRVPIPGKDYVVLVSRTDPDGNDLGGIRTVDVQAPIATYTGWAVRRAGFAEGEDCGLQGQMIPFAATRAERTAKGDPRPSIEERYLDPGAYVAAVKQAAADLARQRLLLDEDVQEIVRKAAEKAIAR